MSTSKGLDFPEWWMKLNHNHPGCSSCKEGTCYLHLWWLHSSRFRVRLVDWFNSQWAVVCMACEKEMRWCPEGMGNTDTISDHLEEHEPKFFQQWQMDPFYALRLNKSLNRPFKQTPDLSKWKVFKVGEVPLSRIYTEAELMRPIDSSVASTKGIVVERPVDSGVASTKGTVLERPKRSVAEIMRLLKKPKKPEPPPRMENLKMKEPEMEDPEIVEVEEVDYEEEELQMW